MGKVKVKKKTQAEFLQDIVNDYIDAGQPWPADRRTIAAWAVQNRRYSPPRKSEVDMCAKALAEAMRLEMEIDPQGRTVRAKHCAKIKEMDDSGALVQRTLWFDRNADPELMHISFQQRRKAILGDNRQLKTDLDSYNENNVFGKKIQLSFNYEDDLIESGQSTEYRPDLDSVDDLDDLDKGDF